MNLTFALRVQPIPHVLRDIAALACLVASIPACNGEIASGATSDAAAASVETAVDAASSTSVAHVVGSAPDAATTSTTPPDATPDAATTSSSAPDPTPPSTDDAGAPPPPFQPSIDDAGVDAAPDADADVSGEVPTAVVSCTLASTRMGAGCRCELDLPGVTYVIACDTTICGCDMNMGQSVSATADTFESSCGVGDGGVWPGSIGCGFPTQ